MTGSIGGGWTAGNRPEPSRPNGRGRIPHIIEFASAPSLRRHRGGSRQGEEATPRSRHSGRSLPMRRPDRRDAVRCMRVRAGRAGERAGAWPGAFAAAHDERVQVASTLLPPMRGVGGARGRERAGPTRSHPEPGRDPAQRRRVLWGRPHGRRGRRGHPPPPAWRETGTRTGSRPERRCHAPDTRRGVEQRQLVGLITQRSGVRIPPPLPQRTTPAPIGAGVVRFLPQTFDGDALHRPL